MAAPKHLKNNKPTSTPKYLAKRKPAPKPQKRYEMPIGIGNGKKGFFVGEYALGDKPTLAVLDSDGKMQCFAATSMELANKLAKQWEKQGFKVLVGLSCE